MAPQPFIRMDKTNEETAREFDTESDTDVAEYEFIVPSTSKTTTKTLTIEDACGNGIVEADEQCDDGNDNDDDWCSNDCAAKTEFKQAEAVLIDEDFTFGLGGFDFCSPLRCTGDNCPTVSAGAVQLNAADNYLCLPSIQVNARGRLVEHAFTINANDALHRIVIRDADADAWRVVLNLRDGLIEYQSPQTGERTAISVDMDNTEGEQAFRVIFDSNAQATYIVLGDTFLGELPFQRSTRRQRHVQHARCTEPRQRTLTRRLPRRSLQLIKINRPPAVSHNASKHPNRRWPTSRHG